MNFDLLPIKEIMQVLKHEHDPKKAFQQIIMEANKKLSSEIWKEYVDMDIGRDVKEAVSWIRESVSKQPETTGIYLGLDTLNMEDGKGTNIEIGLSNSCNANNLYDDWAYECEVYGESHLIRGLYEVSYSFSDTDKWNNEETSFAEYVVFLSYSGVILREALYRLETDRDFLSMWGFHDGDLFYLMQKSKGIKSIVTEMNL